MIGLFLMFAYYNVKNYMIIGLMFGVHMLQCKLRCMFCVLSYLAVCVQNINGNEGLF